jgi:hypothetical protein
MNLQDQHPFDSTVLGLNNIYHTIGNDSFYINSDCIIATGKVITKGKSYVIFSSPTETGVKMINVRLVDVYYQKDVIHLIVQDIRSQRVSTIDHCLKCPKNDCTWILIDINYFIDKMDAKAIQSYCGKCNEPKKKPSAEINPTSNQDDLLDFDF